MGKPNDNRPRRGERTAHERPQPGLGAGESLESALQKARARREQALAARAQGESLPPEDGPSLDVAESPGDAGAGLSALWPERRITLVAAIIIAVAAFSLGLATGVGLMTAFGGQSILADAPRTVAASDAAAEDAGARPVSLAETGDGPLPRAPSATNSVAEDVGPEAGTSLAEDADQAAGRPPQAVTVADAALEPATADPVPVAAADPAERTIAESPDLPMTVSAETEDPTLPAATIPTLAPILVSERPRKRLAGQAGPPPLLTAEATADRSLSARPQDDAGTQPGIVPRFDAPWDPPRPRPDALLTDDQPAPPGPALAASGPDLNLPAAPPETAVTFGAADDPPVADSRAPIPAPAPADAPPERLPQRAAAIVDDSADAPLDLASIKAAALAGPLQVSLHAPSSVPDAEVAKVVDLLDQSGFATKEPVRMRFGIRDTNVRYFYEADAEAAAEVASLLDATLRDFTSYRPQPEAGTIELWLAGSGAGTTQRRTVTAPAQQLLRDIRRLIGR